MGKYNNLLKKCGKNLFIFMLFGMFLISNSNNLIKTVAKKEEVTKSSEELKKVDYNSSTSKEILASFRAKVNFIENSSEYNNFMLTYKSAMFETYYYDSTVGKSKADWDKLSKLDMFIFYYAYIAPESALTYRSTNPTNKEYMDELNFLRGLVKDLPRGSEVIAATEEVWNYIWDQWEKTGKVVNLFEDEKLNVKPQVTGDQDKKDEEELQAMGKELLEEDKKEGVLSMIKDNAISILLLIVVGGTLGFIYYKKRKSKN